MSQPREAPIQPDEADDSAGSNAVQPQPDARDEETGAVTRLLAAAQAGDARAEEELVPLIYHQLRRIAANYMRRERPGHMLQATALVHEAYLHLVDQREMTWRNRAQFFGVAAQLMRRILVDQARADRAVKRGGEGQRISLENAGPLFLKRDMQLETLDDALKELAKLDARQSKIVELRFFGGLTTEEIAEVLGVSTATIERDWRCARAWLFNQVQRHR
jgi:RNA polymerase sigma factor (TIGR02999 family)